MFGYNFSTHKSIDHNKEIFFEEINKLTKNSILVHSEYGLCRFLNIKKLEIFFDRNLNFVKEFRLRGVPTTILINKKGREFARVIGEVNFQDEKFLKWLFKYD